MQKDYGQIHSDIRSIVLTPDDKYLFTGDYQKGIIKQWSINDQELVKIYERVFTDGVTSLFITLDGKYLFVGGQFGKLKQFDIISQQEVKNYGKVMSSSYLSMDCTKQSNFLYICDDNGHLSKFSIKNFKLEQNFYKIGSDNTFCISLLKNDTELLISSGNELTIFSVKNNVIIKNLGKIHEVRIDHFIMSKNKKKLFTSSADGSIKEWCTRNLKLTKNYGNFLTTGIWRLEL